MILWKASGVGARWMPIILPINIMRNSTIMTHTKFLRVESGCVTGGSTFFPVWSKDYLSTFISGIVFVYVFDWPSTTRCRRALVSTWTWVVLIVNTIHNWRKVILPAHIIIMWGVGIEFSEGLNIDDNIFTPTTSTSIFSSSFIGTWIDS